MVKKIGQAGEKLALTYLINKGYQILEHNYFSKFGEVDIIASYENTIIFFEVKTRNSSVNNALSSISVKKQKKISRTALNYVNKNQDLNEKLMRFDVIAIAKRKCNWEIKHIENAFSPVTELVDFY